MDKTIIKEIEKLNEKIERLNIGDGSQLARLKYLTLQKELLEERLELYKVNNYVKWNDSL